MLGSMSAPAWPWHNAVCESQEIYCYHYGTLEELLASLEEFILKSGHPAAVARFFGGGEVFQPPLRWVNRCTFCGETSPSPNYLTEPLAFSTLKRCSPK